MTPLPSLDNIVTTEIGRYSAGEDDMEILGVRLMTVIFQLDQNMRVHNR